jgi:hypothetical protein
MQGKLVEAQAAYGERLRIRSRLAESDPTNFEWQRGLALAYGSLARLKLKSNEHADALPLYAEAARIYRELADRAPDFTESENERKAVESDLLRCRTLVSEAVEGPENTTEDPPPETPPPPAATHALIAALLATR